MKQPTRLGEHDASALSHHLTWASWAASSSPIFAIKGRGRLRGRGSTPLTSIFHLKLVKRRRKKKKIKAKALP